MPDILIANLVSDGHRWQAWREPNTDREMPTDAEIDAELERMAHPSGAVWLDGPRLVVGELEGIDG